MKLQQLRYLCEIVNADFNLSRAAKALHTSQPGVSRYIKLLEAELGLDLLMRDKRRITGLTPGGKAIAAVAKRALLDLDNIKPIAKDYQPNMTGHITIATTHAYARYTLPSVVKRFIKQYPQVTLRLRQGYMSQIIEWMKTGGADLFIATLPSTPVSDVAFLPCHELHRIVLTLPGHPLLSKRKITLQDLARYPIITYDSALDGYRKIMGVFHSQNVNPNIVLSAMDVDIMKTYVVAGLGVAIAPNIVYDKRADRGLRAVDAGHLFEPGVVQVGVRRQAFLSKPMIHFIQLFAPHISSAHIERTLGF